MTDIRKDFAIVVENMTFSTNTDKDLAYLAYQAGRAHDVEGLIMEIEAKLKASSYNDTPLGWNTALRESIAIIRKSFGKE